MSTSCFQWGWLFVGWGLGRMGLDLETELNSSTSKETLVGWVNWYQLIISRMWGSAPRELRDGLEGPHLPIRWSQFPDKRNFIIDKTKTMAGQSSGVQRCPAQLPHELQNSDKRLKDLQRRSEVPKCNACCKRVVIADRTDSGGIAMTAAHTGPFFHRPDCQLFAAKEFEPNDAYTPLAEVGLLMMSVCLISHMWHFCIPSKVRVCFIGNSS